MAFLGISVLFFFLITSSYDIIKSEIRRKLIAENDAFRKVQGISGIKLDGKGEFSCKQLYNR